MQGGEGEGGNPLPSIRQQQRLLGLSPDGRRVNNITEENRYEVIKSSPWLKIHIMSEDLSNIVHVAYIPNTREMPDIVMYGGKPFEAHDTTLKPPQYKECMVAQAEPTTED